MKNCPVMLFLCGYAHVLMCWGSVCIWFKETINILYKKLSVNGNLLWLCTCVVVHVEVPNPLNHNPKPNLDHVLFLCIWFGKHNLNPNHGSEMFVWIWFRKTINFFKKKLSFGVIMRIFCGCNSTDIIPYALTITISLTMNCLCVFHSRGAQKFFIAFYWFFITWQFFFY